MMGAPPKCSQNASGLMVADVMMTSQAGLESRVHRSPESQGGGTRQRFPFLDVPVIVASRAVLIIEDLAGTQA